MIKTDIVDQVYERIGFSKSEAERTVGLIFENIKQALERGEKVHIVAFGTFYVQLRKQRIGRNPRTGKEITISSKKVLAFKPSKVLRDYINNH